MILEAAGWPHFSVAVRCLRKCWPGAPALAVFDHEPAEKLEHETLLWGLDDFLYEPVRTAELLARMQRLLPASDHSRGEQSLEVFKAEHHLTSLAGSAESFELALRKIPLLARSDATVLITGETGSGKELVARALHYAGPRASGPFVPCNCGALPDHLIENELFGHVPGAYTDARAEQKGLLSIADGGTLFLDEINSLSLHGQAKLLRFLQDREYRPLGSQQTRRANVRILAATNVDLGELLRTQRFRGDLFHRLNVLQLNVPALRERAEDIPILAYLFLRRHCTNLERPVARFSPEALGALSRYEWPGNVRELESVVQRAVVLASSSVLSAADLGLPGGTEASGPPQAASRKPSRPRSTASRRAI